MTQNRLNLLAGLNLALVLILAVEWFWPAAGPPALSPEARFHTAARSVTTAQRETGTWAGLILARPVFSISRRPPKVVAGGRNETAPGQARLSGIMINGGIKRAIFAPDGGGHALVLAEHAQVNQNTIRSIYPDRVVMADGTVLRPAYDRNRAPGVTTTIPYQPPAPNFPIPLFNNPNNPGFPPPAFSPPGFQGQTFQPPGTQAPNFGPPGQQNGGDDGPLQQQVQPIFRGIIPPRRD